MTTPEEPASGTRARSAIDMQVEGKFTISDSSFFGYEQILAGRYGEVEARNLKVTGPTSPPSLAQDLRDLERVWPQLDELEKTRLRPSIQSIVSNDEPICRAGARMLRKVLSESTPKIAAEILWRIVKGLGE